VPVMCVMQLTVNQIVRMITMRDLEVPAGLPMDMVSFLAGISLSMAPGGILCRDLNNMLIDVIIMGAVQVTMMKITTMTFM
jgi:hypothetical protein